MKRETNVKKSFEAMAVEMQDQGLEGRSEEFGDMAISHIQLPASFDPSPMFEALPDGVCSRVRCIFDTRTGPRRSPVKATSSIGPPATPCGPRTPALSGWMSHRSRKHVKSTSCWACEAYSRSFSVRSRRRAARGLHDSLPGGFERQKPGGGS
jgi:hypothetical protein